MEGKKNVTQILQLTKYVIKDVAKYNSCMKTKSEIVNLQLPNFLSLPQIMKQAKMNNNNNMNNNNSMNNNSNNNSINSKTVYKLQNESASMKKNQSSINFFRSSNKISNSQKSENKHNLLEDGNKSKEKTFDKIFNSTIDSTNNTNNISAKKDFFKLSTKKINIKKHFINSKYYNNCNKSNIELNDILLNTSNNYDKLNYNENEIFFPNNNNKNCDNSSSNRSKNFLEFILTHFEDYKEKYPLLVFNKLIKKIHKDKENEIDIKLNTIKILFTNVNNKSNKFEFEIPLFYAPIFYYHPINNIPQILVTLIKFQFLINREVSISMKIDNDLYKLLEHFKNTDMHSDMLNSFQEEYSNNNCFSNRINNNNNNDNNNYFKKKKYLAYKYLWITSIACFEVEIHCPYISLQLKKTNTTIIKYIDKKLFSYLYKLNFNNWDYYIINYFYSFKNIRKIIDSMSSKIKDNSEYFNKTIDFSNIKEKQRVYDLNDKVMTFLLTQNYNSSIINNKNNNPVNYLLIIYSFSLEIKDNKKRKNESFNPVFLFNFRQLLFILKAYQHIDYLELLMRFIEESKSGYSFNFENFNSVKLENIEPLTKSKNYDQVNLNCLNENNNNNNPDNSIHSNSNNNNNSNYISVLEHSNYYQNREKSIGKIINPKIIIKCFDNLKSSARRRNSQLEHSIDLNDFFAIKDENNVYKWGNSFLDILNKYQKIDKNNNLDNNCSLRMTLHKKKLNYQTSFISKNNNGERKSFHNNNNSNNNSGERSDSCHKKNNSFHKNKNNNNNNNYNKNKFYRTNTNCHSFRSNSNNGSIYFNNKNKLIGENKNSSSKCIMYINRCNTNNWNFTKK